MQALLASNERLKEEWGIVPKKEKGDFISHAHGLVGTELQAKMVESIQKTFSKTITASFVAGGPFRNKKSLEDTYRQSQPERLDNIYKNSRTMFCTVAQETLWQDIEYNGTCTEKHEEVEERKRKLIAESKVKRQGGGEKKAKKEKETPETPKLSKGNQGKLNSLTTKLGESKEKLTILVDEANQPAVKADIPAKHLTNAEQCIAEIEVLLATLPFTTDETFAHHKGEVMTLIDKVATFYKKLKTVVDAASD